MRKKHIPWYIILMWLRSLTTSLHTEQLDLWNNTSAQCVNSDIVWDDIIRTGYLTSQPGQSYPDFLWTVKIMDKGHFYINLHCHCLVFCPGFSNNMHWKRIQIKFWLSEINAGQTSTHCQDNLEAGPGNQYVQPRAAGFLGIQKQFFFWVQWKAKCLYSFFLIFFWWVSRQK